MFIETQGAKETQAIGKMLAQEIRGGLILCLAGELGAGKTTFTQGFLRGLGIKGPYTSPTFVVMKKYQKKSQNIYHVDAYRIKAKDMLNLSWQEMLADKNNIIIVEWADRIKKIIPQGALWINFEWLDNFTRKIIFKNK